MRTFLLIGCMLIVTFGSVLYAQTEQVVDYDGNSYSTVKIGAQTWMTENLRTTHYSDGSVVPAAYYYNNDPSKLATYGRLYPWNEAMKYSTEPGAQGVCPDGYHLPSEEDWKSLERFIGVPENELNAEGGRGNPAGNRLLPGGSSGFNAQIGGYLQYNSGNFLNEGNYGYYWSSSKSGSAAAASRILGPGYIYRFANWDMNDAMSVRCMKDQEMVKVIFQVDMSDAIVDGTFTEGSDKVYVTGSMADWTEPGDGTLELTESNVDNIYSVEFFSLPGKHRYLYYLNSGWDQPEWQSDVYRETYFEYNGAIIEDVFGPESPKPIESIAISTHDLPSTMKENDIAARLSVIRKYSFPPITFDYNYSLVTGEGSADNSLFSVSGDSLMTQIDLAFAGKTAFNIRAKVEDQFGNSIEESFKLNIKNSNWLKFNPGLDIDYVRQITATSKDNVWAVASNGIIIKTNDGGESWELIETFYNTSPGGIWPSDENLAWIIISENYGDNPNALGLYKTTDGGVSWSRQSGLYEAENSFPNFVYFWNNNEGMCAGDNLEFYTTGDGGNTWKAVTEIPDLVSFQYNSIYTTSVVGDTLWYSTTGAIYRSTDKGNSWQAFQINYNGGGEPIFKNHLEGLMYLINNNVLLETSDGGETWLPINPEGTFREFGLHYDHENAQYVSYGRYSADWDFFGVSYSYDDGHTWETDTSFIYQSTLVSGDLTIPGITWAGSTDGKIFKNQSGNTKNLPPVLNGVIPDTAAREDKFFEYTIPEGLFTDPNEDDELLFTAKQSNGEDLPSWLSMNSNSRTLSGTPEEMDIIDITVTAYDIYGESVSGNFELLIEGFEIIAEEEIQIDSTSTQGEIKVYIPESVFTDMGLTGDIVYEAFMADGSDLPGSIIFDPDSLLFRFAVENKKALLKFLEELDVIIKGTDSNGFVGVLGFTVQGNFVGFFSDKTTRLKIYPQPARDILNIEFSCDNTNVRKISLYSIEGRILRSVESKEKLLQLDLGSLPTSLYYLKVNDGESKRSYQIMKQ